MGKAKQSGLSAEAVAATNLEVRRLAASGEARRIRREAGLSLALVGRAIGADGPSVYRYECGQRLPRPETAAAYAGLLHKLRALQGSS